MSRLGGAGALPSLVNDMPAEVFDLPLSLYITLEYCCWWFWFSPTCILCFIRFFFSALYWLDHGGLR